MNHFFHLLPFLIAHILIAHILVKNKPALLILVLLPCPPLYLIKTRWLDPWRIRRKLRSQGIDGPMPSLLHGNLPEMQKLQALAAANRNDDREFVGHDYASTLFPYFEQWRKRYGPIYMYSAGGKQHLYINDPELVKEMNQCLSSELGKPSYITKRLAPMLGNGILRSNGHAWARQRKILAPQFFMDKVKGMVGLMVESAESLTAKWEAYIDSQQLLRGCCNEMVEISVSEDLRSVSAGMISKACFGSSYLKGKAIFSKLRTLQKAISEQSFLFGLAPRGHGKKIEDLEKEIETLIWEAVKDRTKADERNKDLMQLILEGAADNNESSKRSFIVDNCKNIYFAGHESTAVAASWCFMLLALHPQWQTRIRDEVGQINGGVDADSLHKLKTVTMVIKEVLRLYPPAAFVSREALRETVVGRVVVPKGVCLWTLIPTLHRECEMWGMDANEFKPERFGKGISGACKVPQVYIPFGLGPRVCLGRNFAMAQLKIVVAVVVSRFSFALSPEYRHSPAYRMIVEPGEGVQLLVKKCEVNRGDNNS